MDERIEAALDGGDPAGGRPPRRAAQRRATAAELDAEADRLGALLHGAASRFIAADGRVVGDSAEPLEGVAAMENHAQRPEVVQRAPDRHRHGAAITARR